MKVQRNSKPSEIIMRKEKLFLRNYIAQWDLQIFVIPAVLFLVVFQYIPMWGVLMSFQDFHLGKGFFGSPWVGLKHFEMFFNAPDFMRIMRNTIVISFIKLAVGFPAPII